ncbi:MAG: DUF3515 domain-containing protein [Actinomycetia bacterium]|nr:DUF3515 domain-containing protein [Actinomycetes bacterium]MCH9702815.1 DUF3515 domain-containing protein [Actinomycetes bacterium]MCH9759933.1 DUF3515 domain-containing protein [Actinomycetes bacterium]
MNTQGDSPPRPLLIAALVVAVGAIVAVLVVAVVLQRPTAPTPIVVAAVPAPHAEGPECRALTAALPERLGEYSRAPLLEPAPPGTAAWQAQDDSEALILRCGLDRPLEFVVGAPIQGVDAVQWFKVADENMRDEADVGRSTWFAVDRPVYVALTLPAGSGPTPIQAISTAISETLPPTPIDPGPAQ